MLSASLPSLKPEVPADELCRLGLGLAASWKETLTASRWVAVAQAPGSRFRYGGCTVCPRHYLTSGFPSCEHVPPLLISIHTTVLGVAVSLCGPVPLATVGEGLLSKLSQSEVSPELLQDRNEEALRQLLLGDGNCTHNKGFGAEPYREEGIEHRCLQNQVLSEGSVSEMARLPLHPTLQAFTCLQIPQGSCKKIIINKGPGSVSLGGVEILHC